MVKLLGLLTLMNGVVSKPDKRIHIVNGVDPCSVHPIYRWSPVNAGQSGVCHGQALQVSEYQCDKGSISVAYTHGVESTWSIGAAIDSNLLGSINVGYSVTDSTETQTTNTLNVESSGCWAMFFTPMFVRIYGSENQQSKGCSWQDWADTGLNQQFKAIVPITIANGQAQGDFKLYKQGSRVPNNQC
jgi:hypothetical protein